MNSTRVTLHHHMCHSSLTCSHVLACLHPCGAPACSFIEAKCQGTLFKLATMCELTKDMVDKIVEDLKAAAAPANCSNDGETQEEEKDISGQDSLDPIIEKIKQMLEQRIGPVR